MIVIPAKIKCDHCERFYEQDVQILGPDAGGRGLQFQFYKEPPRGWTRTRTGYVRCIMCTKNSEREPI